MWGAKSVVYVLVPYFISSMAPTFHKYIVALLPLWNWVGGETHDQKLSQQEMKSFFIILNSLYTKIFQNSSASRCCIRSSLFRWFYLEWNYSSVFCDLKPWKFYFFSEIRKSPEVWWVWIQKLESIQWVRQWERRLFKPENFSFQFFSEWWTFMCAHNRRQRKSGNKSSLLNFRQKLFSPQSSDKLELRILNFFSSSSWEKFVSVAWNDHVGGSLVSLDNWQNRLKCEREIQENNFLPSLVYPRKSTIKKQFSSRTVDT